MCQSAPASLLAPTQHRPPYPSSWDFHPAQHRHRPGCDHCPCKMRAVWWHPPELPTVLKVWAFVGEDKACEEPCKAQLAHCRLVLWDVPGSQCFSVAHSLVCVS